MSHIKAECIERLWGFENMTASGVEWPRHAALRTCPRCSVTHEIGPAATPVLLLQSLIGFNRNGQAGTKVAPRLACAACVVAMTVKGDATLRAIDAHCKGATTMGVLLNSWIDSGQLWAFERKMVIIFSHV
jgi:hypothetical protein